MFFNKTFNAKPPKSVQYARANDKSCSSNHLRNPKRPIQCSSMSFQHTENLGYTCETTYPEYSGTTELGKASYKPKLVPEFTITRPPYPVKSPCFLAVLVCTIVACHFMLVVMVLQSSVNGVTKAYHVVSVPRFQDQKHRSKGEDGRPYPR